MPCFKSGCNAPCIKEKEYCRHHKKEYLLVHPNADEAAREEKVSEPKKKPTRTNKVVDTLQSKISDLEKDLREANQKTAQLLEEVRFQRDELSSRRKQLDMLIGKLCGVHANAKHDAGDN